MKILKMTVTAAALSALAGCVIIPIGDGAKVQVNPEKYCTVENAYWMGREKGKSVVDLCPEELQADLALANAYGQKYRELTQEIEMRQQMIGDDSTDSVLENAPEPIPSMLSRVQLKRLEAERAQYASPPLTTTAAASN
ncbi:hypothetical protein [Donghicola tyrosinivorans]|uniref:Lipoprotein n=1 Tax=Donghicola tyrosinivorans TaxID=1652492 RepID=A0A2T0X4X5_9RHOB|nr:hypothetical protein [Donghicola tyrosinivorans]PRY93998.1 hypothetical protein CLV74_101128 [Donghicola tyrosinivorans]